MIEVEAKIGIRNPREFRSKIKKIGKFEGKKTKEDIYYTIEPLGKYPEKSIRIRKLAGHYEVNIKNKISYVKGVHAKKEVELDSTEKDLKLFLDILKDFGFKKWLTKHKISEVYRIKKNFSVEINKVRGLGWFLEVEYLAKPGEIEKARKEVVRVIKKLGIKEKDIIKDGYTKMLWDKRKR